MVELRPGDVTEGLAPLTDERHRLKVLPGFGRKRTQNLCFRRSMSADDFETLCRKAGLGARAADLLKAARPGVVLIPEPVDLDGLPLGASRIGGTPDLPDGAKWPEWRDGPLSFIAQLNLEDLSRYPACGVLPDSGHLLFFYHAEQKTWGFDPGDQGSWQVLHAPPGPPLKRVDPPRTLPDEGRFSACAISHRERLTLPPGESPVFDALGFDEDQCEAYFELLESLAENEELPGELGSSLLLGHPDQIQGDMQTECALVSGGVSTGDAAGWSDPRREVLEEEAPGWRLLLQVASEEAASMMWGDLGCLYYWIHERDLKARQFDRAWMILQCS